MDPSVKHMVNTEKIWILFDGDKSRILEFIDSNKF